MIVVRHETDDWIKKTHYQQGQAYTGAWSYQIVTYGASPTGSWTSAIVNGTDKGFNVENLAAGYYWVFYRIDGQAPYNPILNPEILIAT